MRFGSSVVQIMTDIIGFFNNSINEEAIKKELELNRNPDEEGKLPPFCDAVSYILERL